ncbi:MAG: hypothetical protein ACM3ZA_11245 [Bacillota bacterium]
MSKLIATVLQVLLIIAGLVLLFLSPSRSVALADAWLRGHGGSADTSVYLSVMASYMQALRLAGGVLLGSGLLWLIVDAVGLGPWAAGDADKQAHH